VVRAESLAAQRFLLARGGGRQASGVRRQASGEGKDYPGADLSPPLAKELLRHDIAAP